jgi:hypothetical protein
MRRLVDQGGLGAPLVRHLTEQVGAVLGSEGEGEGRVHAFTIALRLPVRHRDDAQSSSAENSRGALWPV